MVAENNILMEWPIDGKHFCDEIITDFAEEVSSNSVACGKSVLGDAVAFYVERPGLGFDVLVEIIWENTNIVCFRCYDNKVLKYVSQLYAEWLCACEDDSGAHPYRCTTRCVESSHKAWVLLYKQIDN